MVGTGLAIAGIASALGGMFGAKKQSDSANKAAQAQQQATQQAQQYVQQGMGQLGQLYSPYINSGASAQNTLARLTTPGPGARYASTGVPNAMPTQPSYSQAQPRYGAPSPMYGTFGQMTPQQPMRQQMPPAGYYQY